MNSGVKGNDLRIGTSLPALASHLGRFWWVLLLQGLFAVIFGVMAFAWPGLTLASLILLFGALCLAGGARRACPSRPGAT